MKRINLEQGSAEWLEFRKGKIMGSSAGDIMPTGGATKDKIIEVLENKQATFKKTDTKEILLSLLSVQEQVALMVESDKKAGYYKLLAEHMGIFQEDDEYSEEHPMARGKLLEPEARAMFEDLTGKVVTIEGVWVSDKNKNVAVSPDGGIAETDDTEAFENKCLCAWKHLKVILENEIPNEYHKQKVQYFVANEKLQTLYFAFYNPLVKFRPIHIIPVHRSDIAEDIVMQKLFCDEILKQVQSDAKKLLTM